MEQYPWVILEGEEQPTGDLTRALYEEAPEADSLLAEAAWAVWPTQDPDTKRAVLLAAIALEVKVPQVLLGRASTDAQRLLEALLRRHRDSQMSTRFLLNEAVEALGGVPLKQFDGHLAKQIGLLFDLRNEVAHRGITPELSRTRDVVFAAQRVFDWLEQPPPEQAP